MNDRGFLSIQSIFTMFIILIIALGCIFYIENITQSTKDNSLNVESRLFLDKLSDEINQVNSNGEGYTKIISLPDNLDGYSYLIRISSNEVLLEVSNRKGKTGIFPISLVNHDNLPIKEIKLYNGEKYSIHKLKDNKLSIEKVV